MPTADVINDTTYTLNTFNYESDAEIITKEQLKKELTQLLETVKRSYEKKINSFVKIYKKYVDETYEITDPLLIRHFLFVAAHELNYELSMKKKTYRINFSKEVYTRFVEKNKAYYKKHNLFNEDNTVNFEKISKHFASLHDLIRS